MATQPTITSPEFRTERVITTTLDDKASQSALLRAAPGTDPKKHYGTHNLPPIVLMVESRRQFLHPTGPRSINSALSKTTGAISGAKDLLRKANEHGYEFDEDFFTVHLGVYLHWHRVLPGTSEGHALLSRASTVRIVFQDTIGEGHATIGNLARHLAGVPFPKEGGDGPRTLMLAFPMPRYVEGKTGREQEMVARQLSMAIYSKTKEEAGDNPSVVELIRLPDEIVVEWVVL